MREEENEETRRRRKDLSCAKEGEREREIIEKNRGEVFCRQVLVSYFSVVDQKGEKEREKKRRAAGPKNEMPPLETFYRAIRRS